MDLTRDPANRRRGRRAPGVSAVAVCLVTGAAAAVGGACSAGQRPEPPTPTVTVTADREVEKAAAPAPTPSPTPTFAAAVVPIGPELAQRMTASWHRGCPVPLADLRYVTVTHHSFDGDVRTGELVVHADVADGVVGVFRELFDAGYPIRSVRLVDDFGGSDDASMAADNTSAFNCRAITGGTGWSEHAYGRAIDLNPRENPYVRGRHVAPPQGAAFVDRAAGPGVILADDVVVRAFAAAGWQWGGYWRSPTDYQHFSVSGR